MKKFKEHNIKLHIFLSLADDVKVNLKHIYFFYTIL